MQMKVDVTDNDDWGGMNGRSLNEVGEVVEKDRRGRKRPGPMHDDEYKVHRRSMDGQ